MAKSKIVFLGSSDFSIYVLQQLKNCPHIEILEVITLPPKPQGRGYELLPNKVGKYCLQEGIAYSEFDDINAPEVLEHITSLNPDIIVIASFGQILKADFLKLSVKQIINIHPSLLPKYRGATPIQSVIMKGERETGVTIFKVGQKLDAGEMLAQRSCLISENETAGELEEKLGVLGAELLCDYVDFLLNGRRRRGIFSQPIPQDETQATFTRKFTKQDMLVPWEKSAIEVHNFIRAFSPQPASFSFLNGNTRVKFYKSYVFDADYMGDEVPGQVKFAIKKGPVVVKCKQGLVAITELQFPGKRIMRSEEVINGRKIKEGDVFSNAGQ